MQEAVHTYSDLGSARAALIEACAQAQAAGKRPVVLVESSARALQERRLFAAAGAGFGVEITTLANWVSSLWPLHGDARTPLDHLQRMALAARLIAGQSTLPYTPGMVNLLMQAAQESLRYRALPAQLIGNEQAFVELLEAYAQALSEENNCVYCEMLESLAGASLQDIYAPVVFDLLPGRYTASEQEFLQAVGARHIYAELGEEENTNRNSELNQLLKVLFRRKKEDAAVAATGAVTCALAAGPTAEARLVYDCIQAALEQAGTPQGASAEVPQVCVATKNPADLFNFCAPLLAEQGVGARLVATKRFDQTDAGRAVLVAFSLVEQVHLGNDVNKLEAADYSFGPFAGMWYGNAFESDKMLRHNRMLDGNEVLTNLAGFATEELQGVLALFEEGDYTTALDILEPYAKNNFATQPSYLTEQLRALALAREAFTAAEEMAAPINLVLQSLASQSISHRIEVPAAEAAPCVLFTTIQQAALFEAVSIDALVLCGLDVENYPVRVQDNAYATLLAKWGKQVESLPLVSQHQIFYRAIAAAKQAIYVERAVNNAAAEELQPAVVFEELMDCYREKLDAFEDIDEDLGIPTSLVESTLQAGENTIMKNSTGTQAGGQETAPWPPTGAIGEEAKDLLILNRSYKGKAYSGVDLSPSQIESYLECPYKWFAHRRLKVESFVEEFGAMERGTFVHKVLEAFYEAFQSEVDKKVTLENLEQAQTVFDRVFEEQAQRDKTREPGHRYVPFTEWEKRILEDLRLQLREFLKNEIEFLPGFYPAYREWEYGREVPFNYAGCNLQGTVDRIDVDGNGNAVVIDYKTGSVGEFSLFVKDQKEFALPRKMQALIYAKVVRETLGLNVVGALYYNPLTGKVRGAFDHRTIGAQDLFNMGNKMVGYNSVPNHGIEHFDMLLDTCEELVSVRIKELLDGNIAPDPLTDKVCNYCPVVVCDKRKKEGSW